MTRSYEIVSAQGTQGTSCQRLLVFTTAGRKAPPSLLRALLASYPIARRLRRGGRPFRQ
ncbi:MAG TPA: hypothetical protein VFT22_34480 [Kofleriaceae bacterium]|nr:hypothetical protein [Kofleriaceae bacterium]